MTQRIDLHQFSLEYRNQLQDGLESRVEVPDLPTLPFPRYLNLELTNRCNLRCIYCQRINYPRELQDMDFNLFDRLVGEISRYPIESITLNYSGEVMIYPRLIEVMRRLSESGIHRFGFTTNAAIWNEEVYRVLFSESTGSLSISMDTDLDSVEAVRPGITKAMLLKNFDRIVALKSQLNSSVRMDVNSVLHQSQIDPERVQAFADYWIQRADSVTMTLCTDDDIRLINADNNFLPVPGLQDKRPCLDPFHFMAILADGRINLCCNNISCRNLYRDLNVSDRSIADVWNSECYLRIRERLRACAYEQLPICRNCDLWIRHYMGFSGRNQPYAVQFNGYKLYISKKVGLFQRIKSKLRT